MHKDLSHKSFGVKPIRGNPLGQKCLELPEMARKLIIKFSKLCALPPTPKKFRWCWLGAKQRVKCRQTQERGLQSAPAEFIFMLSSHDWDLCTSQLPVLFILIIWKGCQFFTLIFWPRIQTFIIINIQKTHFLTRPQCYNSHYWTEIVQKGHNLGKINYKLEELGTEGTLTKK
jgi:hypothetical protein